MNKFDKFGLMVDIYKHLLTFWVVNKVNTDMYYTHMEKGVQYQTFRKVMIVTSKHRLFFH